MPAISSYQQGTPCYFELSTPDQAAAKEFYGGLFGWTLSDDDMGGGVTYTSATLATPDEPSAHIVGLMGQMPGMEGHPAFWSVYLAVDDIDKAAAATIEAGGKVEVGPLDVMDLGRMASIQDPTGARVNLWQAGTAIGTTVKGDPGTPCWNELVSADLDTATAFYTQVLGVAWKKEPMDGMDYTLLMVGDEMQGGAMPPMMEDVPPHWNTYFYVEDVDAAADKAQALGGKTVVPPFDVPTVGRMGLLTDPQGGMFWVMTGESAA